MNEIIVITKNELIEIITNAIREALNSNTAKNPNVSEDGHVKGIAGLSKFLGVSHSRAQALKNSGIFPHFQTGRLILFDPAKVREAMEQHSKRDDGTGKRKYTRWQKND
jgi:hypothetical protein